MMVWMLKSLHDGTDAQECRTSGGRRRPRQAAPGGAGGRVPGGPRSTCRQRVASTTMEKSLAMRLPFQAMIRVLPTRTLSSEPSLRTTEVRARLNSQIKCGPFQMWAMRCRALATHSQL